LAQNQDIYEKMKLIRSHGRLDGNQNYFSSTDSFDYVSLGYNWRMPTILAVLGLSQMERINEIIKLRQERAQWYHEELMKMKLNKIVKSTLYSAERYNHVCQKYTVQVEKRDELQRYLTSKEIQTRAYFGLPVHLTKYYQSLGHKVGELPITESLSKKVLSLPIYPDLTKKEVKIVVEVVRGFYTCN